jgi:hypothetical protein
MIHSPLLNARLLPSSLTTQSIEVLSGRKGTKHGRYRRSILVSVDHRRNAAGDHVGHELRSIADHQRALRKRDSGLKDPRLEANETWDRIGTQVAHPAADGALPYKAVHLFISFVCH